MKLIFEKEVVISWLWQPYRYGERGTIFRQAEHHWQKINLQPQKEVMHLPGDSQDAAREHSCLWSCMLARQCLHLTQQGCTYTFSALTSFPMSSNKRCLESLISNNSWNLSLPHLDATDECVYWKIEGWGEVSKVFTTWEVTHMLKLQQGP